MLDSVIQLMLHCRFINARRHVVQPATDAAAVAVATEAAADNHESSSATHMKSVLQTEDRSQFWSHAESVSRTAVVEEAHSLSSTPSSTVSSAS